MAFHGIRWVLVLLLSWTLLVVAQNGQPSRTESLSTATLPTASATRSDGPPPWVTEESGKQDGPPPWVTGEDEKDDDDGPPPWVTGEGDKGDDDGDEPPPWVIESLAQEQQKQAAATSSSTPTSTLLNTLTTTPTPTDEAGSLLRSSARNQQGTPMSPSSPPPPTTQTRRNVMIIIAVLISTIVFTGTIILGIVLMDRKHQRRMGFLGRRRSGDSMDEVVALKGGNALGYQSKRKARLDEWVFQTRGRQRRTPSSMPFHRSWFVKSNNSLAPIDAEASIDADSSRSPNRPPSSTSWMTTASGPYSSTRSSLAVEVATPGFSNDHHHHVKATTWPRSLSRQSTVVVDSNSKR